MFAERDSRAISRDDDPEFLFEAYLRRIGLDYDYESEIGGRLPDFWIPSAEAPSVVCEITEVRKRLPARVGSIDASKPVRVKIKKKAPQGKGVGELGVPYVIVLRSQSWPLDELSVSGAMFGRVGFTLPFDPIAGALDSVRAEPSFGQDAQLQEHQHSHVSAVAVLKLFNPTVRAATDTFDERVAGQRMQGDFDLAALFEARLEVFEELEEAGSFDPDALIPRLVIYKNVHAVNPLPSDLLAGPFDETWGEVDGDWIQMAVGIKRNLIPD